MHNFLEFNSVSKLWAFVHLGFTTQAKVCPLKPVTLVISPCQLTTTYEVFLANPSEGQARRFLLVFIHCHFPPAGDCQSVDLARRHSRSAPNSNIWTFSIQFIWQLVMDWERSITARNTKKIKTLCSKCCIWVSLKNNICLHRWFIVLYICIFYAFATRLRWCVESIYWWNRCDLPKWTDKKIHEFYRLSWRRHAEANEPLFLHT